MNGEQYRESLRQLKPEVYFMGEKIESVTDHPALIPHVNAAALTYEVALAPEFEDLTTAKSHLTGERINIFTHIHHSHDDLIKKVKMKLQSYKIKSINYRKNFYRITKTIRTLLQN